MDAVIEYLHLGTWEQVDRISGSRTVLGGTTVGMECSYVPALQRVVLADFFGYRMTAELAIPHQREVASHEHYILAIDFKHSRLSLDLLHAETLDSDFHIILFGPEHACCIDHILRITHIFSCQIILQELQKVRSGDIHRFIPAQAALVGHHPQRAFLEAYRPGLAESLGVLLVAQVHEHLDKDMLADRRPQLIIILFLGGCSFGLLVWHPSSGSSQDSIVKAFFKIKLHIIGTLDTRKESVYKKAVFPAVKPLKECIDSLHGRRHLIQKLRSGRVVRVRSEYCL